MRLPMESETQDKMPERPSNKNAGKEMQGKKYIEQAEDAMFDTTNYIN